MNPWKLITKQPEYYLTDKDSFYDYVIDLNTLDLDHAREVMNQIGFKNLIKHMLEMGLITYSEFLTQLSKVL